VWGGEKATPALAGGKTVTFELAKRERLLLMEGKRVSGEEGVPFFLGECENDRHRLGAWPRKEVKTGRQLRQKQFFFSRKSKEKSHQYVEEGLMPERGTETALCPEDLYRFLPETGTLQKKGEKVNAGVGEKHG